MAKLDKYRPPDYDSATGPYSRWAFQTEPQAKQAGQSWTAWYPGEEWTVSAPTKEEALQQLREEFGLRRMQGGSRYGEYVFAYTEALHRRHLQEPVQGVYAMDIRLYNELRESESDADLKRAFYEAEQKRVMGQPYTKDDYLRNRGHGTRP